ncbi:MAG TPA: cache domain-containing protein [Telluria sp.]|nr:cache domain-containing protein [Telluria sp.]
MSTITRRTALCALLLLSLGARAEDHGSKPEAVDMVKRAVALIKAKGPEAAYPAINSPTGGFRAKDLYVMVFDMDGVSRAHGANPRLIGKNLLDMKDATGKGIIRSFVDVAKTAGSGWIDYEWPNPVSGAIEKKSTYIEKVDNLIVGCGVYR